MAQLQRGRGSLRPARLVTCRRASKPMVYALSDARVVRIVGVLHDLFCTVPGAVAARR